LDCLSWMPPKTGARIVPDLWRSASRSFSLDHLLALAEAGPKELEAELQKRAAKEPAAATWLALHGDDSSKTALQQSAKKLDAKSGCSCEAALGAIGLYALGEKDAIDRYAERTRDAAVAALDAGELERARSLALQVEFFVGLARQGKYAKLG